MVKQLRRLLSNYLDNSQFGGLELVPIGYVIFIATLCTITYLIVNR